MIFVTFTYSINNFYHKYHKKIYQSKLICIAYNVIFSICVAYLVKIYIIY